MDAIMNRRSIRRYTGKDVSEDLVTELIRAAMNAPSAMNRRPWHFIVIRDREKLDSVPNFHRHAKMIEEATMAVLVCGDLRLQDNMGYMCADLGAATENLLVKATDMGLGTVWLGIYPREERMAPLSKMLHLPENIVPFSLVPVGYPAEKKKFEDRYDKGRVHRDGW